MPSSVVIAKNLRFDSRLALVHETEKWLAIADIHYGYELSQRAAGALFPAWGMQKIENRLAELIEDYCPQTVLFLGDLVHTIAASSAFRMWTSKLSDSVPELILIRGNHDRRLKQVALHDNWRIGRHVFHHGHQPPEIESGEIGFSGHLHPAQTLSDGAGFSCKVPVLLQTSSGYILPAFSPWAAGGQQKQISVIQSWAAHERSGQKIHFDRMSA